MDLLKKRHEAQEHELKQNLKLDQDVEMEKLRKVKRGLKGHSQPMHLRIRRHFLADVHITKSFLTKYYRMSKRILRNRFSVKC